jgi:hypothetical protein
MKPTQFPEGQEKSSLRTGACGPIEGGYADRFAGPASEQGQPRPFRMVLLAIRRTLAGAQTKAFLGPPTDSH